MMINADMNKMRNEILGVNDENNDDNEQNRVDYNNSNNIKNRRNRKNSNNGGTSFTSLTDASLKRKEQSFISKTKDVGDSLSASQKTLVENFEKKKESVDCAPSFSDMILRAPIHLWINDNSSRTNKLSIRINLKNKTNIEWIANLTKDIRNFKKYLPEESAYESIEFVDSIRSELKKAKIKPWMGKFRSKIKGKNGSVIEPYCIVVVWYHPIDCYWCGILNIYDWEYKFELQTEFITQSQKGKGCRGYDLYTNQKYSKKGKTWAEQSGFIYKKTP